MPKQLDLIDDAGLTIKPQAGSNEPRLWVHRLVIWKNPGEVLRQIELRPGFNILWSPDPAEQDEGSQRADALGHGSGKTMFCRLLRYCLGEPHFASEEERYHMGERLPESMVGVEVFVAGVRWAVIRPVGKGRQHYAIPEMSLEDILADNLPPTGIEPFLEAVEKAVLTRDAIEVMPCPASDAWRVALAWLSRDQECRFDKVLDWRSADTDSGSPARNLSATKLLDSLRALVGGIHLSEIQTRESVDEIESQKKGSTQTSKMLNAEAGKIRKRVLEELGLEESEIPAGRLGVVPLLEAAKAKLSEVALVRQTVDVSDVSSLRVKASDAQKQVEKLKQELATVQARIPEIEQIIRRIKGEIPGGSAALFTAQNPTCPVCEVPLDQALAEGCKLSHKMPDLAQVTTRLEELRKDLSSEQKRLEDHKSEQDRLKSTLVASQEDASLLRDALQSAEQARDSRTEDWFVSRRLIDEVLRLDKVLAEADELQAAIKESDKQIDEKRGQVVAIRDLKSDVFGRLSTFFNLLIRELMGGKAKGRVNLDGNGIHLSVELDGERSTAAITSLKVIAFDLAVLCMAMEGDIAIPAFLVHDSPREADLGLSLYHRLFLCIRKLETLVSPILFQYILTTTTRPPAELAQKPWLIETLRGAPAGERLLRQDL